MCAKGVFWIVIQVKVVIFFSKEPCFWALWDRFFSKHNAKGIGDWSFPDRFAFHIPCLHHYFSINHRLFEAFQVFSYTNPPSQPTQTQISSYVYRYDSFSRLLLSYCNRRNAIGFDTGAFRPGGTVLTAAGRVGKFRYHTGAAGIGRGSVLR